MENSGYGRNFIVPLDGSNYSTWKLQIRMFLLSQNVWTIVDGSEAVPEATAALALYTARQGKALSILVLSLSPSLLYLVGSNPSDPAVVWTTLENHFQKSSWANQFALRKKLYSLRMPEDGVLIRDHIRTVTELFDNLTAVDDPLKDKDRVMILMSSLPPRFDILITALQSSKEVPKWEELLEQLVAEESRQQDRKPTVVPGMAFYSDHGGNLQTKHKKLFSKKDTICFYCKKAGHLKKDCFSLKKKLSQQPKSREVKNANFMASNPVTGERFESSGFLVSEEVVCGAQSYSASSCPWLLDSGATSHMTNDSSILRDSVELQSPIKIKLANGDVDYAIAKGNVRLKVNVNNQVRCITLFDVLYLKNLSFNLISVCKAVENNLSVVFDKNNAIICDFDKNILCTFIGKENLFHLSGCAMSACESANTASISNELWHRRLGHINENYLKAMSRNELVKNFSYHLNEKLPVCDNCVLGKIHRDKFPKSHIRSIKLLEIVHSDICGPINSESLGGAKYFLTFTDEMSNYSWVYFLKRKDETFKYFLQFKTMVEKEFECSIKYLRSDNGGEYCSNEFSNYLLKVGIQRQLTVPKTPEQNGISERLNRTLMECCRTLLSESKLPYRFWAEAVACAVYVKNRRYSRSTNKTPFEAVRGFKPTVDNLRVFGCKSFYHVPSDERVKLDPKGKVAIFVGYCTERKGYRLYDESKQKVVVSRDVIFDESSLGLIKSFNDINTQPLYDLTIFILM